MSPPSSQDLVENARNIANSFETPDWYLKGYSTNIRIRVETVGDLLKDFRCDSVLDIGCGDGSLSLPLLGRASQLTFLDQSNAMLERVKLRAGAQQSSRIDYVNADFMEARFPVRCFNLIICAGVLAYIQDIDAFLARVASLLQEDGRLILECTDGSHFLSRLDRAYQATTGLLKTRQFETYQHTAKAVVLAAKNQGLCLNKTFRYTYSLPLLSRFMSGEAMYGFIRRFYGSVNGSKRGRLGNQCLFSLSKPGPAVERVL